jgi:hypothetical protein
MIFPGHAHDLGLAQIYVTAESDQTRLVTVKTGTAVWLTPFPLPKTCTRSGLRHHYPSKAEQVLSFRLTCAPTATSEKIKLIFPWPLQGAQITVRGQSPFERTWFQQAGSLGITFSLSGLAATQPGMFKTATDYLLLGIEHILVGIDHLALVLCLFLLARGRRLLLLITGFTIGHSITLTLMALGHVSLASAPVEASIALSIILLAREVMLRNEANRWTMILTVLFGLLHGFGFAGALTEIGMPASQIIPALLSFNIGVELGQLLFILSLWALAMASASVRVPNLPYARVAAAAVGVFAAILLIERSAAILA